MASQEKAFRSGIFRRALMLSAPRTQRSSTAWFDLPAEIRTVVMEQLVLSAGEVSIRRLTRRTTPVKTSDTPRTFCHWPSCESITSLLLVNKQFNVEFWATFMRHVPVTISAFHCLPYRFRERMNGRNPQLRSNRDARLPAKHVIEDEITPAPPKEAIVMPEKFATIILLDPLNSCMPMINEKNLDCYDFAIEWAETVRYVLKSASKSHSAECAVTVGPKATIIEGLSKAYVDQAAATMRKLHILKHDRPLKLTHTEPKSGETRIFEFRNGRWLSENPQCTLNLPGSDSIRHRDRHLVD